MQAAFECLDKNLRKHLTLIMGGGGAMIYAHRFPLATTDVDAIPKGMEIHELEKHIAQVAKELNLPSDWLNAHFANFAYVLLPDSLQNLIPVFKGEHLQVQALSANDMLVMKCFAHRPKDISHAKALVKGEINLEKVEKHIEALQAKGIQEAKKALDFLDDIVEQSK